MKNQKLQLLIFASFVFLSAQTHAETDQMSNLLAIAQGISSPTMTSMVNYTNGFTRENPVGVTYQTSVRLSGEHDSGDNFEGTGAELGTGDGSYGLAIGYYKVDCDTCEGNVAGALGAVWGGIGFGLRFEENLYSLGILLNANGTHRLGLALDLNDSGGSGNKVTSFGAGYAFVKSSFTFSVDASKRDFEGPKVYDDLVLVTPGLSVRIKMIALSVSRDLYLNKQDGVTSSTTNDDTWFGIGFGTGEEWHIAVYADYVNEWAVVGSLFF